ncbi:hypothetical protein GWI33_013433 [Rhynchophorus ferrugineus]|uniref:Uncharacterized protein n=1 Tax=Rhynchophorus ferrugineus TaxID=354439 RepID=A0A834M6N0_RHYFE|nr:hypothetical protein GWI33_013433 [Rhynchophorus ferrugineus]
MLNKEIGKRVLRLDHCLNNLKLHSNVSLDAHHLSSSKFQFTCLKRKKVYPDRKRDLVETRLQSRYVPGSLDNISCTPWEDLHLDEEQSSLRRTRSLAISRENLFYSLDYTDTYDNKTQLIPRAKLVEKSFIRDRCYRRGSHQEDFKPTNRFSKRTSVPTKKTNSLYLEESTYNVINQQSVISKDNAKKSTFSKENCSKYNGYRRSNEDLIHLTYTKLTPRSELVDRGTKEISITSKRKSRYLSLDSIPWNINTQHESIPYDENITLSKRPDNSQSKPRTIRGSPLYCNPDYEWSLPSDNETVSKETESFNEANSSFEFETNTNCDEIKLNNEKIAKQLQENIREDPSETGPLKSENTAEISESPKENHNHNYIKDILETQKGSRKPLQAFLSKKFSNFTRKSTKSSLISNQFHSLPDITASKSFETCEIIDRKLRKCEKRGLEAKLENRFIINIGRHFDINGRSNPPLDFEVKIAKVPKKKKHSTHNERIERESEFKKAIESINQTLENNGFKTDLNNNINQTDTEDNMNPEMQEKVDNVRNYWTKIMTCEQVEDKTEIKNETNSIVSDVKKKFEPAEPIEKVPSKVQLTRQMFEPKKSTEKGGKISPTIRETCNFFEKTPTELTNGYESLCPSSVEIISQNDTDEKKLSKCALSVCKNKNRKSVTKSNSISNLDFDYVRYRVVKPDLFKKKIITNCENESQFDGLIQYLADYSIQELLIDNNIVIIEPIRTKASMNENNHKKTQKKEQKADDAQAKEGVRKHFFYRPVKVNKEVIDDELPNPEVVRQAREFFQQAMSKNRLDIKEQTKTTSHDPDKDKCSVSDSESNSTDFDNNDDYDSIETNDCCNEYVSEDILEKIRQYGTTITYYGGKIVDRQYNQSILTKVIMNEIKDNQKRCSNCCTDDDIYEGLKFKLIKSNSCSSRLELTGKKDSKRTNKQYSNNQTDMEINNNTIKEHVDNKIAERRHSDKDAINENIKLKQSLINQPRIIGEEMKQNDKKPNNDFIKINGHEISDYEYHQKLPQRRRTCDMEFEAYEVASPCELID